jgi:hypothetical protein
MEASENVQDIFFIVQVISAQYILPSIQVMNRGHP